MPKKKLDPASIKTVKAELAPVAQDVQKTGQLPAVDAQKSGIPREITITPEEMHFIEQFRKRNAEADRAEYLKSVAKLEKKRMQDEADRKQMEIDRQLVKGKFVFHEVRGGTLPVTHRKWAPLGIFEKELKDGHEYEIPLYVAEFLNNGGRWPVHENHVDENGKKTCRIGTHVDRYNFYPVSFVDTSRPEMQKAFAPNKNLVTSVTRAF